VQGIWPSAVLLCHLQQAVFWSFDHQLYFCAVDLELFLVLFVTFPSVLSAISVIPPVQCSFFFETFCHLLFLGPLASGCFLQWVYCCVFLLVSFGLWLAIMKNPVVVVKTAVTVKCQTPRPTVVSVIMTCFMQQRVVFFRHCT